MTLWESLVLGVLQGATEFLPVSSSGHLVMGQAFLGIRVPGVGFEVALHLATLLSVLIVYRARIVGLVAGAALQRRPDDVRYLGLLLLATIPAGVVGIVFGGTVESLFESPRVVGIALLVTGSFLISTRWALRRPSFPALSVKAALIIGVAQAFALVPGISRSGATVATALWLGVSPIEAAAFSFLMSVPAIAGAGVLQIPNLDQGADGLSAGPLVAGSLAAALAGVLAIRLFLNMLKKRSFPAFAWYCWGVGLLFLSWLSIS